MTVPFAKKWLVASRPWALPASTMPIIFGTSLAVVIGQARLDFGRFLLALLGMVILHMAANMLSDVFDYKRGLDTEVTPVSGAIVRDWLTTRQVACGSAVLFIAGSALGILLVVMTGKALLLVGAAGVAIGLFYTVLKYHALGDLAVFLDFGIFGSLGAWVVQTRSFSWLPVVWAIPAAMLVSGILHANNWRDIVSDSEKKVTTFASILGDRGSLIYYGILLFGSMGLILLFMILPRLIPGGRPALPLTFFIMVLAIPQALRIWGRAVRRRNPSRPLDFIILDGATAQYNLVFGLLATAALWLDFILNKLF